MSQASDEQGLFEQTITYMVFILGGAMQNLVDEVGAPLVVPIRSRYAKTEMKNPQIYIDYQPGEITFQPGFNILDYDETDGEYRRGFIAKGSEITMTVNARTDPERYYLVDRLVSVIVKAYGIGATGEVVEAVDLNLMGWVGINPTGFSMQFPEVKLDDQRSQGQVYPATLTMHADVWHVWNTPPIVPRSPASVQQTVTLGPSDEGLEKLFQVFSPQ